jgi:Putative prokaryotic signal transducing protein
MSVAFLFYIPYFADALLLSSELRQYEAMKRVYNALNLPDAHLLRDLLEQAGIPAHVFNENAASIIGLAPVSSCQPQVWIAQPHQEQHANAVVTDYQTRMPTTTIKNCVGCGEPNPGEFECCWRCGGTLAISGET